MDPVQQKALNALESFIILSKSATSPRSAADLVNQATSAPNTYVFAELLQTPNIAALKTVSAEYASYYTLLQIFSWGTWADYSSTPKLPQLSDPQAHKLRQLSLLSLSTSPSTLTYSHLQSALSLPSVRALEDLVISAVYAGLLTAKLDPKSQRVDVSSVSPLRDLCPGRVPQLVQTLNTWDARCVTVLGELEAQVAEVKAKALERRKRERRDEVAVEKLVARGEKGKAGSQDEKGKVGGKRGAQEVAGDKGLLTGDGNDEMDLDDGKGLGRTRGAKRGGGVIKNAAKRMMG
ncbi:MAG: hypothetical protein LQ350_008351 [Teloschistes chrysophthalmus]|nr:MAG: hypothetical protein LQ350_008351 [Niorma chrysophthalma]